MGLGGAIALCAAVLAVAVVPAGAIDNGVGWLPVRGWSTWNTFRCAINETLIRQSAAVLAHSSLRDAGYEYVLIDDCWTAAARDTEGRIQVNATRFPSGFKALTDYVHSLGLKIGIYTSVSAVTCGGYVGSLHHEEQDAQSFAEWGFDFVKHDTCGTDCGIHDGCIQNASRHMRDGLNATGRPIVYYLDSGNPTSPQRVYNPHNNKVANEECLVKVATKPSELVWVWAKDDVHMFKSWFDLDDTWHSTLTNMHNQIRVAEYQACGRFNMPDMMTVGMGAQTVGQYRVQFFVWSVLGAPLILGCDVRGLNQTYIDLVTAPEVLAINQDKDCVQGSLAHSFDAGEVWIKPLHDQSFAVVLVNKGPTPLNMTVYLSKDYHWGSFYPASFEHMRIRDAFERKDLGVYHKTFSTMVPALDASIYVMADADEDQEPHSN